MGYKELNTQTNERYEERLELVVERLEEISRSDELEKDFKEKFVAFAYEDICKEIFARLCSDKTIDFTPSKIGSYWLNDKSGNTQIDVMAVDTVNKRLFAGECKYYNQY